MNGLREAIFSITNRCNSKCRMCDIPSNSMEELSTSEWKKVIKETSLIGAETVVFSGGEPLLREDIFELISFARNNHINACLTTNGLLIDDGLAHRLSVSGIGIVNISVEGPEDVHDYLRGKGTFKRALFALENLRRYNVESTVAVMVSRYNYEQLPFIVGLAKEYGATTVRFQPFSRIFIEDGKREKDFLIETEDVDRLKDIIESVIKLCARYGIATSPVSYLRKIPLYLSGERVFPQNGCNALWTSLPVNARGDLFPCWVVTDRDKVIGNVAENGLFRLWASNRHNTIIRSILRDGCPGCMMSCYDEVFGRDELKKSLSEKAAKLGNIRAYRRLVNRFIQFIRRESLRLRLRYNFYRSYRGSFGRALGRIFKNTQRRMRARRVDNRDEIARALEDIASLKERLKKESARYR